MKISKDGLVFHNVIYVICAFGISINYSDLYFRGTYENTLNSSYMFALLV